MSYTKILKIIIDVYSTAQLEYPDNKTVTVWLKDGNVPYLQSRHLLLTVVTSLVLVFLFLPYTLLLLLGYKLYRFSGRKHMRWLNRLKPLLDSYYAPYNKHTRCWTGFLLLVRCALYIVFTLGDASRNLFFYYHYILYYCNSLWIDSWKNLHQLLHQYLGKLSLLTPYYAIFHSLCYVSYSLESTGALFTCVCYHGKYHCVSLLHILCSRIPEAENNKFQDIRHYKKVKET